MSEQERALWAAVYVAAMGKEVDCHEVATQAVREMRASEHTLAAEAKAAEEARRGEPPFKVGDRVSIGGTRSDFGGLLTGEITAVQWSVPDDEWRVSLETMGRVLTMVATGHLRKVGGV